MKVDKNGYAKCSHCGASRPTAKMVAAETCSGCGAVSSMICRGGCVVHERWIPDDMPVAHEHAPVLVDRPVDGVFKVGDRVRHKYAPTSCVGVVIDARGLECRVRVDAMPNVPQPDERWIPNYNLEHVPMMHVDHAALGSDRTVAVLHVPVDERKVAEAYRAKVLEAFDAWGRTPSDRRTLHEVVMGVDLP